MEHVSVLTDFGNGKRCLIVGGGHSLNDFGWDRLPSDIYIICLNNHLSQMANMIFYYDKAMKEYFMKHTISDNTKLVGFQKSPESTVNTTMDRCNYHYNTTSDVEYGDSGYMSLQLVDKVFNFNDIFLIGYDYKVKNNSYHHNETVSDDKKINGFVRTSIERVLPRYDTISWSNNIYNCNKDSNLKKFEYKLPYKETN